MILFFFQIPHEAVIHHTLHYFADAACQSNGAVTRWIRLVFEDATIKFHEALPRTLKPLINRQNVSCLQLTRMH